MNIRYIMLQYLLISATICNTSPLRDAVSNENILEIQKILTSKTVNVNEQDEYGYTLLHLLIYSGEQDYIITEILINAGANPNIQDCWGNTPLHELINSEDLFIDKDEPELEDIYKDFIKLYIQSGANLNLCNNAQETPLLKALIHECYIASKLLLDHSDSFDVNAKNDLNLTSLHIAAFDNALEIAKLLIHAGAHINNCDNQDHATPLHFAIIGDAFEVAQLLIESGADKNIRDRFGLTAFNHCKTKEMRNLFTK